MNASTQEPIYAVLSPVPERAVKPRGGAPRLDDLAGKVIAELWDAKFHGDAIYTRIRAQLRARFADVCFIEYSEFGNFYGPQEGEILGSLPDKLRRLGCDAVITGIGA